MESYLGEIRMFCGDYAPQGWVFCDGRLLAIANNTALFALLGTTYGGNGIQTFALPNLGGCVPIHPAAGQAVGETGGDRAKKLTDAHMPPHTHTVTAKLKCNTAIGAVMSPVNAYPANTKVGDGEYNNTHNGAYMAADAVSVAVDPIASGNGGFTNMQQFQVVNFIISLNGVFPPRP